MSERNAWLVTWNPNGNDKWDTYALDCAKTLQDTDDKPIHQLKTINDNLEAGDEVFLLITGRGLDFLAGHGVVKRGRIYKAAQQEKKSRITRTETYADIEFHQLIDYKKNECITIDLLREKYSQQNWNNPAVSVLINDKYVNDLGNLFQEYFNKSKAIESLDSSKKKNYILYGPPGTGKTYHTAYMSVSFCNMIPVEEVRKIDYSLIKNQYDSLKNAGRIEFITFHQSYGYEEFIEGIKPDVASGSDSVRYTLDDGVFKRFCRRAEKDPLKPYVFIIDEINRGNISKIFGELITMIEETKRKGTEEEMYITLPYSGELFSVPNNVYIIGTMNTADRSIALLDVALRRRFQFEAMYPSYELLYNIKISDDYGNVLNVANMLRTINERIECLADREHMIGHSFFLKLKNDPSKEKLSEIFRKEIIPLLEEYFFNDYEKIRLVLGDNGKDEQFQFYRSEPLDLRRIFNNGASVDIAHEENRYMLNPDAFNELESYIGIKQ